MDERQIAVGLDGAQLSGDLVVPSGARGVVLFAHGSGSSRHSPRNRQVAEELQGAGLATLLIDLLTGREEEVDSLTAEHRFDIPLLSGRLEAATAWLDDDSATSDLNVGYFGASTGAAAALVAAAHRPEVKAVVSRGGRPDLAADSLEDVKAPTLLIVGGRDEAVIGMNRSALQRLVCEKRLQIIEGATHLFEEPGALEQVSDLAGGWFLDHLSPSA